MTEPSTRPLRAGPGWAAVAALLLLAGLGVALYLARLHLDLFYGAGVTEALCDFGGAFNCSTVNSSPQSEIFGVPQAVLALPVYGLMLGLVAVAWSRQSRAAVATLAGVGLATVLYSGWLAYLSSVVIGAWCVMCIALYAINLGVTGLALRAGGSWTGWLGDLRRGLGTAAAAGICAVLLFGAVWFGYEQVRAQAAAEAVARVVAPPAKAETARTAPPEAETKKLRLSDKRVDVPIPAGAPVLGKDSARVTIVEFSDFQCPFCKRLAATLDQLVDEYPEDLRVAYVYFPLNLDCNRAGLKKTMHPGACDAAIAGYCAAEQGHFWEMHDRMFDRQGELRRANLLDHADALGLDRARFETCLDAAPSQEAVAKMTEAGTPLGVSGTPTFFINGRQMAGAQPIEVLRAVIDAELAGNTGALDLEVPIGTETTGAVSSAATVQLQGREQPFTIDAFEASLDGTRAASRPGAPVAAGTSWYDARDACAAAGKRLCTEKEWLQACTGQIPVDADGNGIFSDDDLAGRGYGYGERRRAGACADSRNPASPGELLAGNHPQCGTPEGVYDLVGNVKEWVGLSPATAALKGGSYSSGESARCGYFRDDVAPDTKDPTNGFRCCEGPAEVPETLAGRDVGETLAPFKVTMLDGSTFDTKKLNGKPTILTFWASWCGPCKKELPILAALYEKYKDQGLQVLAISVDADEGKMRSYLDKSPLPFPIGHNADSTLLDSFNNRGVPTSLWIRADGTIRLRTTGVPPGGDKRLEELVNELLAAR